jgi:hypothetical protein
MPVPDPDDPGEINPVLPNDPDSPSIIPVPANPDDPGQEPGSDDGSRL